ncbi:MAG: ATP-dependent helicase [Saprospiraceae bacterium]|nr:ATP-dependent helicase [Saprospiraceae bacterium]
MANPSPITQYNETFSKILDQLNTQQKAAVDQIEGPVLVLAGPGTGKTHILSARIGKILQSTDTQANNILCLTFTDAGVQAMRERLITFIGPEAHRVHIYTFHSFCNTIIQDNLELFGRHDLEPLSDLERVEIIRRLIDDLDIGHPLKRGRSDPYFYEGHLYDLFTRMKSEDWSIGYMNGKIQAYLDSLPQREEFIYKVNRGPIRKGMPKEAKLEEMRQRMNLLRSAVAMYPNYQYALKRARRYDFDDMILWVLRAFEENEALLRNYQEQYLYFLVDEFQDTNGAQNELLNRLSSYWDNPNIFIVGDDDQSIYEFQGARLKNLLDFYHRYEVELSIVLLQENYRSSQPILQTAHTLIGNNERRIIYHLQSLGIEKKLVARHPDYGQLTQLPVVNCYANRLQEEADILQQIENLQEQGYPLNEVAVIYARHRQAERLIALLEKKGIPYTLRRKINLLDQPLIRNLRLLLEYLWLESERPKGGEHLLFKLLHFTHWGLTAADLARFSIFLARMESGQRPSWREGISRKDLLKAAGVKDIKSFQACSDFLELHLRELHTEGLPLFLEHVINRSRMLKQVMQAPDRLWLVQVLFGFFEYVRQEANRYPRLHLGRLLEILKSMDDNRLAIPLQKTIESQKGVNFLTAHSAKGLEFQTVFVMDLVKDYWEPSTRRSSYRFVIPDTLSFSGEEDAMEARRRLFYVAITRAKENLVLSYSLEHQGKPIQRTRFLDEIASYVEVPNTAKTLSQAQLLEANLLQLVEVKAPTVNRLDKSTVDALLADYSMSVSSLNRYLKCPLGFYYETVLRVPSLQSEAATYGTAMHNSLQRLYERMLQSKQKRFPAASTLLSFFETEMEHWRAYFTNKGYQRRLKMGQRYLADFYQQNSKTWSKKAKVEHTIRNVEIEGVPVNGTIDKLIFQEQNQATIIDYKTGSQDARKLSPPSKSQPHGGNYWRQLIFYKLLYETFPASTHIIKEGQIAYLEPDSEGFFPRKSVSFKAKDVALVKQLIVDTYAKIKRHEFYEGCGKPDCQWCNFTKDHVIVDSFSDPEIEALDD